MVIQGHHLNGPIYELQLAVYSTVKITIIPYKLPPEFIYIYPLNISPQNLTIISTYFTAFAFLSIPPLLSFRVSFLFFGLVSRC